MIGIVIVLAGAVAFCSGTMANQGEQSSAEKKRNPCYLCGNGGLMGYYGRFDSIGLLNLNTGQICDVQIFAYEEDGKTPRQMRGSENSYVSSGEHASAVSISSGGTRRIGHVTVLPREGSNMELKQTKKHLCSSCINRVFDIYKDRLGEDILDTVFVDFTDREIYPIDQSYVAYFIRDYYLHFDFSSDRVEVLIFYAPEE